MFLLPKIFHPAHRILCEGYSPNASVLVRQGRFHINYRQLSTGSLLGLGAGYALGKFGKLFIVGLASIAATIAYITSKGFLQVNWNTIRRAVLGKTEEFTTLERLDKPGIKSRYGTSLDPMKAKMSNLLHWLSINPSFKLSFATCFWIGFTNA
ncbi:mitocondrial FUN14 family protein [Schizosaccharomyces japonicus yFS275]|uniref:Mitocondrial FUN14 family protein n=1 Tax=Schizosaccharomyces japonicus (strain yFS275 / FY16936) TaxID=402676 RepID=B6K7P2_SCHJY|nr:mitocondrial FUN14 family protein [Schizosaccharomyces japonicus yFS275]EEB09546.1 mitocondrial FUN14 family protein [Schizosaccharomyces japonicus yFS275]